MKKLIVFGPTGKTGLAVLARTFDDQELQVTAYLRSPQKVPEKIRQRIRVIIGDVFDAESVADALEGQDVAISCLGAPPNFGSSTVLSQGVTNILNGMRKHRVREFRFVGGGFLLPGKFVPFPINWMIADQRRAKEVLLQTKDINWICAAPPFIIDKPFTGTCKATINKVETQRVTTHDLADWLIRSFKDSDISSQCSHQLVGVSSTIDTWFTKSAITIITVAAAGLLLAGVYLTYY